MTFQEMRDLMWHISYKPGWSLHLVQEGDRPYLQWQVQGADSVTHQPVVWSTGKRYLSYHMCRQEVVSAAFSLALSAEEHEVREWFRYKGASIYNPHLDPEALAELARWQCNFNVRDNAMNPE